MATPALRALRRAQPQAEITLLGPASHAGLLSGLDSFDHFLPIRSKGLGEALARMRALRARAPNTSSVSSARFIRPPMVAGPGASNTRP